MRTEEVIILAGGLGTRLRPLVHDVPKPLAPVAGRPFLAWLLDRLAVEGVRHVCLATGYMAETLEKVIGRQWQGMVIDYSVESQPLGTGGALLQALSRLQGGGVHVCNGDTWLCYSLRDIEAVTCRQGALGGVALAYVDDTSRYGAVCVESGRIISFNEKGCGGAGFINGGSYFLTRDGLDELKMRGGGGAFSLETDFLYPMADKGKLSAFLETRDFIDIGIPEDYLSAQTRFMQRIGNDV